MSGANFEDSPVWYEVLDIIKNSKGSKLFKIVGTIHTEKEDIGVWDLNDLEKTRDFLKDFGDSAVVRFKLGLGDYTNRLWPCRNNLEFTIKRIPMADAAFRQKTDEEIITTRYKAIFNQQHNPAIGSSDIQSVKIEDLNVSDIVEVELELLDRGLEPLRIKTTSGIFRKIKLQDYVTSTLGHESNQVLVDGKPVLDALDIVEFDNKDTIQNLVVANGMHLTSLTTFLQNDKGLYNQGIGTYFMKYKGKRTWFVYPVYDASRFDKKGKKVIFYMVPQEKLPQLERSYWEDGDILKVAITAQRVYNDSAGLAEANTGGGFRMPDARSFMKKPVVITPDGPVVDRARLNHEVVNAARKDGLDYAPVVTNGVSANVYVQRSAIVGKSRGQIDIVWEGADEELIFPGMPAKCVYLVQGKVKEVKGTVLFLHSLSARIEKNNAQAFKTTARITLACEQQDNIPDLPSRGVPGEE